MNIKFLKSKINYTGAVALIGLSLLPTLVFADAAVGDSFVSLGANLDKNQRNAILDELDAPETAEIIEVTNAEEHKYLGESIPKSKIGKKALSSSMITYTKPGSGIKVDVSDNINYITESTYRNALTTAGVTDAEVKITAPTSVSGTAALTGILKAYEVSNDIKIDENLKKVANQEMVVAQDIQQSVGENKTDDLINAIKVQMSQNMPENEEQVRNIINNVSQEYNINISDNQVDSLVNLFVKMKNSNVDWDKVAKEASKYSKVAKDLGTKASDYLSSEQGQQTLEKSKGIFSKIIDFIKSFFAN